MKSISVSPILIVFCLFLFSNAVLSQSGFNKKYQLTNTDFSACMDAFEAPNGNIILVGYTNDTLNNSATNKLSVLGLDAAGQFLWRKDYGRTTFQYLYNLFTTRAVITDGTNFYLYSIAADSNNKYLSALIKFNYTGDTLWQKKFYDSTDYLYIQGLTKSVDNGFLLTGFFEGTLRTTLLIKTDSSGNELWRKKIQKGAGINTQVGKKVIQDSATGKIIIVGHQYEPDYSSSGNFSGYANIIVTNSLGVVLTKKVIYTGNCGSDFLDLIQTKDKKCVAVGNTCDCDLDSFTNTPSGSRRYKSFAVKFDPNNLTNLIWEKQFDTLSYSNAFSSVVELNNGDIVFAGAFDTVPIGNHPDLPKVRLIRLNQSGSILWKRYLDRDTIYENTQLVGSINKTADESFLMANQLSYLPNGKPFSVIKTTTNGCDSSAAHCATMNVVSIPTLNRISDKFNIYPTLVTDILNIESSINNEIDFSLNDILGTEIKRLTFKHNCKIELSSMKSGVYFVNLINNKEIVHTTKIIKE